MIHIALSYSKQILTAEKRMQLMMYGRQWIPLA